MKIISSYLLGWRRAFQFKGWTTRKDFWFFVLGDIFVLLLLFLSYVITIESQSLSVLLIFIFILYWIGTIFPRLTLIIRRLRDMGRSGYWIFFNYLPLVGPLTILYWSTQPSLQKEELLKINHIKFKEIVRSYFSAWRRSFDFKGKSNRQEFSTILTYCPNHFNII